MPKGDNLPNGQLADALHTELLQQPRMRVANIASGAASITLNVEKDVEKIWGFIVFDSDGEFVVAGTHGLTAPTINSSDGKQIDFTGTAAAAYVIAIFFS